MTFEETLRSIVREELRGVLRDALPPPPAPPAPAAGADDRALTVPEAAAYASYTAETLMERIRAGDLPAHKPKGSREWRVRFGDLKAWLWRSENAPAKVLDIGELSVMMRGRGSAR